MQIGIGLPNTLDISGTDVAEWARRAEERGFSALSDAQFRKRFDWIAAKRPKASRAELEDLVSRYHLARQEVRGTALCCDVETREHCACDGWNRFDNRALERFCLELTGRAVQIG